MIRDLGDFEGIYSIELYILLYDYLIIKFFVGYEVLPLNHQNVLSLSESLLGKNTYIELDNFGTILYSDKFILTGVLKNFK